MHVSASHLRGTEGRDALMRATWFVFVPVRPSTLITILYQCLLGWFKGASCESHSEAVIQVSSTVCMNHFFTCQDIFGARRWSCAT
jgi:hypothetical protein